MKKLILILLTILSISCSNNSADKIDIYIGTYTEKESHVDGKADGIYKGLFDTKTGGLSDLKIISKIKNPSFLNISKDGKQILAVSELGPNYDKKGEVISILKNDQNIYEIIDTKSSMAYAPCHISSDKTSRNVFTANYLDGILTYHKVDIQGKLSFSDTLNFNISNEVESHLHQVVIRENTIYVPDLGKDKIWIINFDSETGKFDRKSIKFLEIEKGSGPRHLIIPEDGNQLFCLSEYSNTIDLFQKDNDGNFMHKQRLSTLPDSFKEKSSSAEIVIHPNQKFIYSSNRGHNSVSAFKLENGVLKFIDTYYSFGEFPRSINIDPSGDFLLVANQNTDNIYIYQIDNQSGELIKTQKNFEVKTPVDIEF